MDNLPTVEADHAISSWGNKVNRNIAQNKVVHSADLVMSKGSNGTTLRLSKKFRFGYETLRYRGEYDPNEVYTINDVVRVLHGKTYTDITGTAITCTPGVWICVVNVPGKKYSDQFKRIGYTSNKRYLQQDGVDYFPKYPEPTDKATLDRPNGRYWDLLSLLPVESQMCDESGNEVKAYVDTYQSGSLSN